MKRFIIVAALFVALGAAFAEEGPPEPKKAALPVVLNILPGFGVGSFVEGDAIGGLIGLGGEAVGISCAMYGLTYFYVNVLGIIFWGMSGEPNGATEGGVDSGLYMLYGGLALWAGTKVFEILRPIWYARRYNEEHVLVAASLAPTLAPTASDGGIALMPGLALGLSY